MVTTLSKSEFTKEIADQILQHNDLSLHYSEEKKNAINELMLDSINGDEIIDYLILNSNSEKGEKSLSVLVLTNLRIIHIIFTKEEIQSLDFLLDSVSVTRKLIVGDRFEVKVFLKNGFFTVNYKSDDKKIRDFFRNVDIYKVKEPKNAQ